MRKIELCHTTCIEMMRIFEPNSAVLYVCICTVLYAFLCSLNSHTIKVLLKDFIAKNYLLRA